MEELVVHEHENPPSVVWEGSSFAVLEEAKELLEQWIQLAVEPSSVTTWGNSQQLLDDFEVAAFRVSPDYLRGAMAKRGYTAIEIEKGQFAFYCQPRYYRTGSLTTHPPRYNLSHLPAQARREFIHEAWRVQRNLEQFERDCPPDTDS